MMLKPSGSRNQRSKSLKVKHALQICLLLAICIWLLYQVKQSYNMKSKLEEKSVSTQVSGNGESVLPILKLGRKDIKPQLLDEELDLEDEESKDKETVDGDEEIEEGEKDKTEEGEPQQLQDLIDEDDKDE
ncbi:hypothetical protein Fot_21942 [Forsythia ovata]|uniref:Uncharacterized protein n=1 Tax=Forsythia ovata TaxID=205694 RepID=A0ABD1UWN8_9LAMI